MTTDKTNRMLNVFNRRCLRDIMGVSWKDHNDSVEELLSTAGIGDLHDIVWQTGGDDSSGMYCASRHQDQPVW